MIRAAAVLVTAAGLLAAFIALSDRTGAYTDAGTLGYYALPFVGVAGGVVGLRFPVALAVGAAAVSGWVLICLTQTEVNGLWAPVT